GHAAHGVILVIRVAFGLAPAVGQPVISIVFVAQDFHAGLIELVGDAAIFIIFPRRGLVLAVFKREQVAGKVVSELQVFRVGVGQGIEPVGQSPQRIEFVRQAGAVGGMNFGAVALIIVDVGGDGLHRGARRVGQIGHRAAIAVAVERHHIVGVGFGDLAANLV